MTGLRRERFALPTGVELDVMRRGRTLVLLLCGGDKSSQSRDLDRARSLAAEWEE